MTSSKRNRYGNWMPVRQATLGGLTLWGWAVLLVAIVVAVVFGVRQIWIGSALVLLAALVFEVFFVIRWGGEGAPPLALRLWNVVATSSRVGSGEVRFNTGLFSNLPPESLTALPGMLGALEEIDGTDGTGAPFTILHHRSVKTLTAVFACNPDGIALRAQDRVDNDVAVFGAWIASHAQDSAIAGASVIVDTSLQSSEPLQERIRREVDPNAPEIARRATLEAARMLPKRFSEAQTWATVTWAIPSLADRVEDAVAEVASKLPYHREALRAAGGGAVHVATSGELARMVRVAYRPDRSTEFAEDLSMGIENRMRVTQAGPDVFDESLRRRVLHDGVASMTALVVRPPRMEITENTMTGLMGPSERFLRKRVAIFYRPVALGRAVKMVEQMNRSNLTAATAKSRVSADDRRLASHGSQLEDEISQGAAMTQFGMAVTVTFQPEDSAYREATIKLKNLLESSALGYRFCEYDAAAAFHSTLPLGILPWLYESEVETVARAVA